MDVGPRLKGKGCQWMVASILQWLLLPCRLLARWGLHCLQLPGTDGIAWGPKLWALLCAVHTNHTQAAIQRHEKAQKRKPLWSQVLINSPRQFLQDKGRGMRWHKIHQTFTSNLC